MKKTLTNGEVYTMAQILFGGKQSEGLINKKHLKTRMAVRHALKFNYLSIETAYKTINEMIQDIIIELMEDFVDAGKADKSDEGYSVKKEYQNEFLIAQQKKLNELSDQSIDIELTTIPEKEYNAYAEQNDGELTEIELDILETFVEFEKDKTKLVKEND